MVIQSHISEHHHPAMIFRYPMLITAALLSLADSEVSQVTLSIDIRFIPDFFVLHLN
jgi:hypothetical protein